jgi:hypothetical protein
MLFAKLQPSAAISRSLDRLAFLHLVRFPHDGGENFRQNGDMKCAIPVLVWFRVGMDNRITTKTENQFVPFWNAPF